MYWIEEEKKERRKGREAKTGFCCRFVYDYTSFTGFIMLNHLKQMKTTCVDEVNESLNFEDSFTSWIFPFKIDR